MTRAAIYARVSTARQAERDLSLPDQIAQCRAYASAKGGRSPSSSASRAPRLSTTTAPSSRR